MTDVAEANPGPERIRLLTNRAVTVALVLGLLSLLAAVARGLPAGAVVVPPRALPGALARLDSAALASVGVLWLLLAPIMRVVGLVVGFWTQRDRAALAAGLVTLALLALTFVVARAG